MVCLQQFLMRMTPVSQAYECAYFCHLRVFSQQLLRLACDNTQAVSYYINYIHDTQAVSDYVLLLHNTKFGMPFRLTIQCQLNKKHTYVSASNYSLSHCNNMQSLKLFWSITCGIFVMNLKLHNKSLDYDVNSQRARQQAVIANLLS